MKRVAEFITKHCCVVFVIFLVLAALCGFLTTKVKINHDVYSYMPADSETTLGLNIMKDEFNYGETSSWQIMFEDLDEGQREEVRNYLESVEEVKSVSHDDSDEYFREKDGHTYALYDVIVDAPADSEAAKKTYDEIYEHIKKNYTIYQAGEVFMSNGSVLSIGLVLGSIGCAMVILFVMSESFIEPLLYLFTIMIAVILNKGTNIMFPSVSHVTDGIALILQMALSMDYAIMLSSRYRQEKANPEHPTKQKAMERALRYSFGAITSSSVTTVVGLLVLIFMSFTIGKDMGLVLSKGVILSLVSIFTVMPALLLFFDKWIEKTKKKVPHINMKFLGDQEYRLRRFALPIFVLVFAGAFLLKGNMGILYTTAENNRIKDVFPAVNQVAVVYENSMEEKVAELCAKFTDAPSMKRAICYSNTLGEAEKYNEIVPKANELSRLSVAGQTAKSEGKNIEVEEYLVKVIYYYYYRGDKHTMSLTDFVKFIQDDVINSGLFDDEIDDETIENFNRLALFILPEEANKPRSKYDIAEILGIPVSDVDDLYTLYLAKRPNDVRMTPYEFASFVKNEILTDPKYSEMMNDEQKADLEKMLVFANPELPDKVTPEQLIRFMLENEFIKNEVGITDEEANEVIDAIDKIKEILEPYIDEYPEIAEILEPIESEYSYDEYIEFAEKFGAMLDTAYEKIEELNEKYELDLDFSNLEQVQTDLAEKFKKLKLLAYIVDNRATKYSATELADVFGLDLEQLRLVYALYDYRYVTGDLWMSLKQVVEFLTNEVFVDVDFAGRLGEAQKEEVRQVARLMWAAEAGTMYSYDELYRELSLLSDGIDRNQLFLLYLYHGSLYDYDESWALSIEQFVEFLNEKVLPDVRFADRIGAKMREDIIEAKTTVADGKKMLVGSKHSRVLFETYLPSEGKETTEFLVGIKNELGEGSKTKYFLAGDSAMAYEMSLTFGDEMNFITMLTMIAIFIVVALTFKSVLIPLILVLTIQTAVYINMAYLSLTGQSTLFLAIIIVQSILMGATIDYAILYTSYYLEQRNYYKVGIKDAIIAAYNKSVHSILTSASILILVTMIVGNFAQAIAAKICQSISGGTIVSALIILLLLPAMLATLDRFIVKRKK